MTVDQRNDTTDNHSTQTRLLLHIVGPYFDRIFNILLRRFLADTNVHELTQMAKERPVLEYSPLNSLLKLLFM